MSFYPHSSSCPVNLKRLFSTWGVVVMLRLEHDILTGLLLKVVAGFFSASWFSDLHSISSLILHMAVQYTTARLLAILNTRLN